MCSNYFYTQNMIFIYVENRIRNKTNQNLSNFTVYLTISKNHVGKYIFWKSEDIKTS